MENLESLGVNVVSIKELILNQSALKNISLRQAIEDTVNNMKTSLYDKFEKEGYDLGRVYGKCY